MERAAAGVPSRAVERTSLWEHLGARPESGGTRFTVWAPLAERVEVALESATAASEPMLLQPAGDGLFTALVPGVGPGALYRLSLDGRGPYPDPASRYQPLGVHGPSQVIDPHTFVWTDDAWRGRTLDELVLYELHVGTFTPQGTFTAAIERLPHLVSLGVTAIELMPLADFPGERNWGYDGAALFAPAHCYGTPDELRLLVDRAHQAGLAVHLDVVLNHLGPDGAYLVPFAPPLLAKHRPTGWGPSMNLDGAHSAGVRELLIQNAIHWVREYHLDGLRLDATPAFHDESPRHFLAELGSRVRAAAPDRPVVSIAEDVRNLSTLVRPESEGGLGLDATWSFDFHHQIQRILTGRTRGYFGDFEDSLEDLAKLVEQGWLYTGQPSRFWQQPHGTDPAGIPPARFVFYLQNHDEVGNRLGGERLHHRIDPAAWRAALALLLIAPQTPLLFMGQEWSAGTPFHFFTDHKPALGERVAAGRLEYFERIGEESGASPDMAHPQHADTFAGSRLEWAELEHERHAAVLALHAALLGLRRSEPGLVSRDGAHRAVALDDATLLLRRDARGHAAIVAVVRLRAGSGRHDLSAAESCRDLRGRPWTRLLDTEQPEFAPDPRPIAVADHVVEFTRPGAVIFRAG